MHLSELRSSVPLAPPKSPIVDQWLDLPLPLIAIIKSLEE